MEHSKTINRLAIAAKMIEIFWILNFILVNSSIWKMWGDCNIALSIIFFLISRKK